MGAVDCFWRDTWCCISVGVIIILTRVRWGVMQLCVDPFEEWGVPCDGVSTFGCCYHRAFDLWHTVWFSVVWRGEFVVLWLPVKHGVTWGESVAVVKCLLIDWRMTTPWIWARSFILQKAAQGRVRKHTVAGRNSLPPAVGNKIHTRDTSHKTKTAAVLLR